MTSHERHLLVGVFVGGRGRRMGGVSKGLLPSPETGEPLLTRALRVCREALPDSPQVLVGDASAYGLEYPALPDDPPGIGPLGGLHALLLHARERGQRCAIALSCDLPHFSAELLRRLAEAHPEAALLAPRQEGLWQPLFARYGVKPSLAAVEQALNADERSLQKVFERLEVLPTELVLDVDESELLLDWDTPEDLVRQSSR